MPEEKVVARLPRDLVDRLVANEKATPIPQSRSADSVVPAIAIVGTQLATTLITLAQGPMTARDLAAMLFAWGRRRAPSDGHAVRLQISGPNGRVTAELRTVANVDELAEMLSVALDE